MLAIVPLSDAWRVRIIRTKLCAGINATVRSSQAQEAPEKAADEPLAGRRRTGTRREIQPPSRNQPLQARERLSPLPAGRRGTAAAFPRRPAVARRGRRRQGGTG